MRPLLWLVGLTLIAVGLIAALSCYFTVDRTEYVYVTQFGQHVATVDGETDAGWHWKLPWPVQTVQRLDHRLQVFDLPETEVLTHDPKGQTIDKTLSIGAYVCWRIGDADGVDRFIRTVGTPDRARTILGQQISSRVGASISNMPIDDLISVAGEAQVEERMNHMRDGLLGSGADGLQRQTRDSYGIELVDIRLRRFNHPLGVREAIFERIRSERSKKAREYDSEGARQAKDILSLADREAKDTLTQARADAERMRKEADVKADDIRNQAQAKDPEFYTFLQKLKTYQNILSDTKDVLLLSSKHELFDMLLKPPKPANGTEPKPPATVNAPKTEGGQP
jgi:membrane protease subunit HflC